MLSRTFWFLLQLSAFFCLEHIEDRPVIYTKDGHLNVEVTSGKHIRFIVPADGKLYLNKRDLTEIVDSAHSSLQSMQQCKVNSKTAIDKLAVIENRIDGNQGIFNRILVLEKMTNNTLGPGQGLVRIIRRRVNNIQKRLNRALLLLQFNDCNKFPCKNGGTCQDMYNSYQCICPSNWQGPNCDVDVDECAKFLSTELGCQNGATCLNKPGTYECKCANGWYGLHCTKQTDDCSGNFEVCGHGICVQQSKGYKCICDQGWKTDGTKPACTVDVNECESYHPPCSSNPPVPCINLPGTFYCGHCPPGYSGNGFYCTDINECEILNGGCSMSPMVQCVNTLGSRICGLCPPGYVGNGISCTYQGGVCGVANGGCHPAAQCRDNPRISASYVECICPEGYSGNGFGPNGCVPGARNACLPNPCLHGTCTPNGASGYTCSCTSKYTGTNCDIRKNACDSNPCQNGGTCINIQLSFSCVCPPFMAGALCQVQQHFCGPMQGSSGTLRYPPKDMQYSKSMQISCAWKLQVNPSKTIQVRVNSFYVPQCAHTFLQVHDGRDTTYPLIGRFCENKMKNNTVLNSTTDQMYIWFRGDGLAPKPYIEITWNTTDPICGESISVNGSGTFKSPGSPNNYPPNRNCYWLFTAPIGQRIKFIFYHIDLGNNNDCTKDFLNFHEDLAGGRIFYSQCSTNLPEPIYSPSNEVRVHLRTVESHSGFLIHYSLIPGIAGCGAIYTLNNGIIKSPEIRDMSDSNVLCQYMIQLASNARLELTFTSWKGIGKKSADCSKQFVALYSGNNVESPLIGRYCGKDPPDSIIVSTTDVLVVYKDDWKDPGSFELTYKTTCGGTYVGRDGALISPKVHSNEDLPIHCFYKILRPESNSISLKVKEFNLDKLVGNENCLKGYLLINDGDSENATTLGKFCDRAPEAETFSSSNVMMITFYVNEVTGSGLSLSYESQINQGCGGVLRNKVGSVESPENLDSYITGLNCSWILRAPADHLIQITWVRFNLEKSYKCVFDHVQIIDNSTNPGNIIGNFCGNTLPPNMVTTSNVATVLFKIDATNNFEGFMFTYRFVHEDDICGGRYFSPAGVIKSPKYPANYPPNTNCAWVITAKPGQQLMLNVTFFKMEKYFSCRYDYLEIRNGGTSASPLIGKYCGSEIPQLIYSHTNQIYLHFVSDGLHSAAGFFIEWSSAATGCGGSLSAPLGTIISPHYPEPYSKNTECFWKIDISAGSRVQMIFADLDLEPHSKCFLDFVEIFDGIATTAKSLGRYCTTRSGQVSIIQSAGSHVTVKFRSDLSFQGRGFQLQYSTLCKTNSTGFGGVIESPNFPNGYPHDLDCLWQIEVPRGNTINITFSHFELQRYSPFGDNGCKFDYLQVLFKIDYVEQMQIEGTYCSTNQPGRIALKSNVAQIKFVTDSLLVGSGFRLEWNLNGCGGKYTHPDGTIQTPFYPKAYPYDIECHWLIETEYGHSIQITFSDLDLEVHPNCVYDYVEIFNGVDDKSASIAKFCTSIDKPIDVTSIGPSMFIKFTSMNDYKRRGFSAKYKSIPSKCGGTLTAPTGSIHSPNYPKNYDKNDSCSWLIEVTENHLIQLEFEDLDFLTSCEINHVKIFDGPTSAYPLLGKLCGPHKPKQPFKSRTNHMFVEMVTHNFITTKGFLATYKTACGARIKTQSSGIIDYTFKHHTLSGGDNCSWTIISERPDEHIFLTVTFMDTAYFYCGYDGLSIYDGEDHNATLIGTYCDNLPSRIKSTGSVIHLENVNNLVFTASYSVLDSACGGNLNFLKGLFSTPNYPDSYPVNVECEWIINVAPGNRISISFSEFDIVKSEFCNEDYLEVREYNRTGKFLGSFCGNNPPSNLTANATVWFYFKSEKPALGVTAETGKGFLAEYTLIHGNEMYGKEGQIGSPGYPGYFTVMEAMSWKITVAADHFIEIFFPDYSLKTYSNEECYSPAIIIYDGPDQDSLILANYCGNDGGKTVITKSNTAFVMLFGTAVLPGSKFLLQWKEINRAVKNHREIFKCDDAQDVINLETGGSYNLSVHLNSSIKICTWTFISSPNRHLKITFDLVKLNSLYNCFIGDRVRVYSANEDVAIPRTGRDYSQINATICNATSVGKTFETSHGMIVKYFKFAGRLISSYATSSFNATIRDVCGGLIKNQALIQVDNNTDPVKIGKILECEWRITVRTGRKVQLEFLKINFSSDASCSNYLMIRNGHSLSSPPLGNGKYCNGPITDLVASGNEAFLRYRTGQPNNTILIKVSEERIGCDDTIVLTKFINSVNISSPNYPNAPNAHIECSWIISVPNGEAIRIDFLERFDLVESTDCTSDYVEVRDGATEFSPLVGRFCKTIPSTQVTLENMMYVKYYTDVDNPRNGFKAQISIASCGGVIRDEEGSLKSPGYMQKNNYPLNAKCRWEIEAASRRKVLKLTFTKIDLPFQMFLDNTNCTNDNVRITEPDPLTQNETTLGIFCGRKEIPPITTTGSKVFVYFTTSSKKKLFNGFKLSFKSTEQVCGGSLETPSGVISSPGYPAISTMSVKCEWTIKVTKGRRVKLTFEDIGFISAISSAQGLICFNGNFYTAEIYYLSRYANITLPHVVKSNTNDLTVYYWSTGTDTQRGFKAHFTSDEPALCGDDIATPAGVIVSPQEPTYFCHWTLSAPLPSNRTYSLEITSKFNGAYNKTSCAFSTSNIFITHNKGARKSVVATICRESQNPVIVRSLSSNLQITGVAKKNDYKMNFTITFKQNNCGGELFGQTGYLTSTNNEYDCAWKLLGTSGDTYDFKAITFNLEDCDKSYFLLYNGASSKSPKIGKYCGTSFPSVIKSQSNHVWIEYHGSANSKFNISYASSSQSCGGMLTNRKSATNYISTPLYPKNYDNNEECYWEFQAQNGYFITLKFDDRFQLEESSNCEKDFVSVYEDPNGASNATKLCGRHSPGSFNSSSNQMFVLFRTNERVTGTGFKATWTWNCGGTLTATEDLQYISSPGYPEAYGDNLNCTYFIRAPGKPITINFLDFEVEKDFNGKCAFDRVKIYNLGFNQPSAFCGTTKPPQVRMMNSIKIDFQTDRWVSAQGFKLSYKIDACGGVITEPQEIEYSLQSGQIYRDAIVCRWNITAPEDKRINIRFLKVNISPHFCYIYFISVVGKNGILANICGEYTNPDDLPTIFSNDNSLSVMFYVQNSIKKLYNFLAAVEFTYGPETGCGGVIKANKSESVVSFNTPGPNYDCIWHIQSDPNTIIKLGFKKSAKPGPACPADCCIRYTLLDGNATQSEEILNQCDLSESALTYFSSLNTVILRLRGNDPMYKPLSFKVTSEPNICGNLSLKATDTPQTISTPLFPQQYPLNVRCVWRIYTNYLNKIQIQFRKFNLNDNLKNITSCEDKDRLEIADKGNKAFHLGYELIWKKRVTDSELFRFNTLFGTHAFCSPSDVEYEYVSPNNQIELSFFSNQLPKHGNGFLLEYKIATCDRNYTALQGTISKYWHNGNCSIYITVPQNYTISLFFTGLGTIYGNCSRRSLEIFDGDAKKDRLMKICNGVPSKPVFSTGSQLYIRLSTTLKFAVRAYTLEMTYTTTKSKFGRGCGGSFYNFKGSFSSPLYPTPFAKDAECMWTVKVPLGLQVAFKLTVFDIEGDCSENNLKIWKGSLSESEAVTYCPKDNPAVYVSSDSSFVVKYTTSSSNTGTGWNAKFMAITSDMDLKQQVLSDKKKV